MKASLCIGIGCLSLLLSAMAFAGCNSCGSASSSCSDGAAIAGYYPSCDCTDPGCSPYAKNDCLSMGECCEAFGNIGAR
jgi:hypothetical protein